MLPASFAPLMGLLLSFTPALAEPAKRFESADRALAASHPVSAQGWCGKPDPSADTTAADAPAHVKLVYVYPADKPDRFEAFAPPLQATAQTISARIALAARGRRTLRWASGTECGPNYVALSRVRLAHPASAYVNDPEGSPPGVDYQAIQREVMAAFSYSGNRRNYALVVDQILPQPGTSYGMAEREDDQRPGPENLNNLGGRWAFAFGDPEVGPGFNNNETLASNPAFRPGMILHELLHTLGAVGNDAPHGTGGGHCSQAQDLMCYPDGGPRWPSYSLSCSGKTGIFPYALDCGGDDYFSPDPAAGSYLATQWNIYNSDFLGDCAQLRAWCELPGATQVARARPGSPRAQRRVRVSLRVTPSLYGKGAQARVRATGLARRYQWRVCLQGHKPGQRACRVVKRKRKSWQQSVSVSWGWQQLSLKVQRRAPRAKRWKTLAVRVSPRGALPLLGVSSG